MTEQDKEYLKDLFAGFAMCGLVIGGKYSPEEMSLMAYKIAETMIDVKEFKDVGIKGVRKRKAK